MMFVMSDRSWEKQPCELDYSTKNTELSRMTFNNDNSPEPRVEDNEVSSDTELGYEAEDDPLELLGPLENGRISSLKLSGKLKISCIQGRFIVNVNTW